MEKPHEPSYASPRLIGQLYRRVKTIDDILKLVTVESEQYIIQQDPKIDYKGWQKYQQPAMDAYESYATQLQNIMDSYSIKDEGELFSSCFVSLKNRVSDRDQGINNFFKEYFNKNSKKIIQWLLSNAKK